LITIEIQVDQKSKKPLFGKSIKNGFSLAILKKIEVQHVFSLFI